MEKPHMDQLKIYKRQVRYPKRKSPTFYTVKTPTQNYRHATRHFKRLPAFAKRINEIWCLDLAFMDKLSDSNNGVKYLLVCVDIFSRFVRVQPMKSKYSTDAVVAFKKMLRKKVCRRKYGLIREQSLAVSFDSFVRTRKSKFTLLEVKRKLL